MPKNIDNVIDKTVDLIEKVSSPSSRAGSTVERVAKMRTNKVDEEVIALQMTKNSFTKQEYDVNDIRAYEKLYKDTTTKVGMTAAQTRSLIEDTQSENIADTTLIPQPQ